MSDYLLFVYFSVSSSSTSHLNRYLLNLIRIILSPSIQVWDADTGKSVTKFTADVEIGAIVVTQKVSRCYVLACGSVINYRLRFIRFMRCGMILTHMFFRIGSLFTLSLSFSLL